MRTVIATSVFAVALAGCFAQANQSAAENALAAGRLDEAAADIQAALQHDPDNPELKQLAAKIFTQRGVQYYQSGTMIAAADDFHRAVDYQPNFAMGWDYLGSDRFAAARLATRNRLRRQGRHRSKASPIRPTSKMRARNCSKYSPAVSGPTSRPANGPKWDIENVMRENQDVETVADNKPPEAPPPSATPPRAAATTPLESSTPEAAAPVAAATAARAPQPSPPPIPSVLSNDHSLGQIMTMARERHGGSRDQAANASSIPAYYLTMIESDDYSSIADQLYLLPFLRRYAIFVESGSRKRSPAASSATCSGPT